MSFLTKQDQVADILRERVIAGAYRRGERLKQADIAKELGVSITLVREALHILEAEGYVAGVSHRGLLVPEIVPEQANEIFDLRRTLERDLTARALERMTPDALRELKALQRVVADACAVGRRNDIRAANYRFHFRLYELADRQQTLQFVRILWARYPFAMQDAGSERLAGMNAEHEAFLARIEAGDMAAAADAMVSHIERGWRMLAECETVDAQA